MELCRVLLRSTDHSTRTVHCPFLFFFSSRRRHTRSLRDWSSDVCSSDLPTAIRRVTYDSLYVFNTATDYLNVVLSNYTNVEMRSEERRVGKECRSRWWWYP